MPTPLYATYDEWIEGLKNWLTTDDQPTADTNLFLYLGQQRLNRELQSVPMEASETITITAPMVGLPIDLLAEIPDFNKIRLVVPYANAEASTVVAMNEMVNKIARDWDAGSYQPYGAYGPDRQILTYYTIDSRKLWMHPWPGEGAVVSIFYYRDVPFIKSGVNTNIFGDYHSDLLLYASLLAGSQFIIEDERIPVFMDAYSQGLDSTNNTGKHQNMGSTVLGRQIKGLS